MLLTPSFPTRRSSDLFQRFFLIDICAGVDVHVRLRHALDAVPEFLDQKLSRILVDRLVDGDHRAHLEQRLDEVSALFGHTRSEEHTSELQSLMRISYAVFCLQKETPTHHNPPT